MQGRDGGEHSDTGAGVSHWRNRACVRSGRVRVNRGETKLKSQASAPPQPREATARTEGWVARSPGSLIHCFSGRTRTRTGCPLRVGGGERAPHVAPRAELRASRRRWPARPRPLRRVMVAPSATSARSGDSTPRVDPTERRNLDRRDDGSKLGEVRRRRDRVSAGRDEGLDQIRSGRWCPPRQTTTSTGRPSSRWVSFALGFACATGRR